MSRNFAEKRYGASNRSRPTILNRTGIEDQSGNSFDSRKRMGDWEGDTIIGAGCNSGAIVSTVERMSRFTILAKVENKNPAGVTKALIEKMGRFSGLIYLISIRFVYQLLPGRSSIPQDSWTTSIRCIAFLAKFLAP